MGQGIGRSLPHGLVMWFAPRGASQWRRRALPRSRPLIMIGALILALIVVTFPSLGVPDFGSDVISMLILIGALAFAQDLDRRSGAIVALLAGAVAAIVPGVPTFPPRSVWEVPLRCGAFIVMSIVYFRVIVALRNRDERAQRQVEDVRMLHGEVRALHALAMRVPIPSDAIRTQIAQGALRLARAQRSRLVHVGPTVRAIGAQWPPAAWDDDGDDIVCPRDVPYAVTMTHAGDDVISVPLTSEQSIAAVLQVERPGDDGASDEYAQFLAVYAHDANLALDHLALREQLERLVRAEERGRIARALHDGLVQSLGGIAYRMDYFSDILAPDSVDTVRRELDATGEAVRTALKEARLMIHNLRAVTPSGDVCARLRATADDVAAETGIAVAVDLPATAPVLLPAERDTICLIVQEALQNVAKHAQVAVASVMLSAGANGIEVTISDDGRGFDDHDGAGEHALQYGILGMAERAAHHGGAVTIQTERGRGTRVTLSLPTAEAPT